MTITPNRRPTQPLRHGAIALRLLIVLLLFGGAILALTGQRPADAVGPLGSSMDTGRYTFADLADRVMPSVVTVYVKENLKSEMQSQADELDRLHRFFRGNPGILEMFPNIDPEGSPNQPTPPNLFGLEGQYVPTSSGSGIVISNDGYILTSHHVLSSGTERAQDALSDQDIHVAVVLNDGTEIDGDEVKVVYSDWLADLALIKIDRKGLTPIQWGDSDKLRVGERIVAVGSPLDLKATVTQGIVCAKGRHIAGMSQLIQTDAVINPGSSGGALVNLDGELVGVNRLITSNTGRWQGFGFAIPSNDAKWFSDDVIGKGRIEYGYLGVFMWRDSREKMQMLSTLGFDPDQPGVLIQELPASANMPDGNPAYNGGLRVGDLIVEADGHPIRDNVDLLDYVKRRPAGSKVNIAVLRTDESYKPHRNAFDVVLGVRPSDGNLQAPPTEAAPEPAKPKPTDALGAIGIAAEPGQADGRDGLRITEVAPRSPAARAGLQPDDLIVRLNRRPIASVEDFEKAAGSRRERHLHLIEFLRDGRDQVTSLEPGSTER
jgi:serine protease Do